MITFKFDLESQRQNYDLVIKKLKETDFYQNLNFYVLPKMPEKTRDRVVYLPETFEPEKIYKKHRIELDKLKEVWTKVEKEFVKNIKSVFPYIDNLEIQISPSLYGTIGFYEILENKIIVKPRYDRSIVAVQKLIINSLVHYFNPELDWEQKQAKVAEIQATFFPKHKSMLKILDTQFAGKLAEESAKYLEKLKASSKFEFNKPENLTKSERNLLNLLLRNKNKLVTFDQIAEEIWREKVFEKYSEYAITTLIKKLKKKLRQKTNKNIIHPQRGVGYILHT